MKLPNRRVLLATAVLSLMFTSCNVQDPTGNVDKSADSSQYEPVTFHQDGRDVWIPKTPEKVLTLGPNCTEIFIALGLGDLVTGNSLNNHSRGPLPEFKQAYERIPELNHSSATRERVLTSGADFIYGIDWEFGEEGLDIGELASYGIHVLVNQATTLDELYEEIRLLGEIFNIEDQALELINNQQDRIAAVTSMLNGAPPVKVLVYDSGGNGVFTCGGNNLESTLLALAGGTNIFSDIQDRQWTTVSYESILERQPEFIVIHDYDAPSLADKIQAIQTDPVLSQLSCVQEQKFISIPLESVLPGVRGALTVETFAKGFYPNLFE